MLQEGHPTSALYQILQGSLRVELQLKDQAQAVVVGHRGAGEMFGETSLLKASNATASIVTDSDEAIVVCIEGAYLDSLFKTHPALPGRFFAFLAGYQARRLRSLTDLMSKDRHEVAGQNLAKVSIEDIFSNPAYMGIFRKFMTRTADEEPENRDTYAMSLAMFEFFMDVQDYKSEPDPAVRACRVRWGAEIAREIARTPSHPLTPRAPPHTALRPSHTLTHPHTPSHTLTHPHTPCTPLHPLAPSCTLLHPLAPLVHKHRCCARWAPRSTTTSSSAAGPCPSRASPTEIAPRSGPRSTRARCRWPRHVRSSMTRRRRLSRPSRTTATRARCSRDTSLLATLPKSTCLPCHSTPLTTLEDTPHRATMLQLPLRLPYMRMCVCVCLRIPRVGALLLHPRAQGQGLTLT